MRGLFLKRHAVGYGFVPGSFRKQLRFPFNGHLYVQLCAHPHVQAPALPRFSPARFISHAVNRDQYLLIDGTQLLAEPLQMDIYRTGSTREIEPLDRIQQLFTGIHPVVDDLAFVIDN